MLGFRFGIGSIGSSQMAAGMKRIPNFGGPSLAVRSLMMGSKLNMNYMNTTTQEVLLARSLMNTQMIKAYRAHYSTKTAPPPPPPPPQDKNTKGKVILNRISRAFTFSLSTVLVIGAAGVAMLVVYLILSELFLPSGDTKTFNKAVKLVEQNEEVQKVLQMTKKERLKAYGETPAGKWVRNRPVQSIRMRDKEGKDRLAMKFHVESSSGKHGTVSLEQIDKSFWSAEFAYIALDVPKAKRIYIIEPKFQPKNYVPKLNKESGFLGLKWGPKKD